jgi:hypothetical protein
MVDMGVRAVGGCRMRRGLQVLGLPLCPEWPHPHEPIIPVLGSGRKEIECVVVLLGREKRGVDIAWPREGWSGLRRLRLWGLTELCAEDEGAIDVISVFQVSES